MHVFIIEIFNYTMCLAVAQYLLGNTRDDAAFSSYSHFFVCLKLALLLSYSKFYSKYLMIDVNQCI